MSNNNPPELEFLVSMINNFVEQTKDTDGYVKVEIVITSKIAQDINEFLARLRDVGRFDASNPSHLHVRD